MQTAVELDALDARWDASFQPFGHQNDRRLGARGAVSCWAVLKGVEGSVYARVQELSTTGLLLRPVEGQLESTFRIDQLFVLDLLLGGAHGPVHTMVRRVRPVGELEAFEFLVIAAADRLSLAEYLDTPIRERGLAGGAPASRSRELWYLSLVARGAGRPVLPRGSRQR